ncbi:acetolactate synthase small subunit [Gammaproteobacteria bacterium]|jgi:acetolactate synthase I/III small subunit|nr:acetolactate synthase small subunit [Gammaproteobacteria bacterium]MDA8884742.1 acetolactate synthase small subunit [Gammaproteobacteria bacterium]MDB9996876.1 acetolactate synthase small subunit [Gammaproteobacteria bacterium]|tara:strand:- start:1202 stop:1690 length:489 start_codon:yes stop_codon:yes gene_type:complete
MKRVLAMLVENKPGALARVVGLFHQRGYNIESLNVAPVDDGSYSRLTVTTRGSESAVEQIMKQINKLIDIIKVADLTEGDHHELELALIKVNKVADISSLKKIIKPLDGKILKNTDSDCVISITGTSIDINQLLKNLKKYKIIETVRTGTIGLHESQKTLTI